ncbi:hypothetical protein Tco_0811555 [Tanacetum coccineum]
MPRDDPIIERIPRRSLKKRNITPSKNELPHIGSNVAFEENMISRFNIGIARRTRDGLNIHTTTREIQSMRESVQGKPPHKHIDLLGIDLSQVWYEMKGFAGLPNSSSSIDAILNDIYSFAMKKTSRSVIAKLVLAAVYYEFRLKLMSCRWKKTRDALEFIRLWKLSEALLQPG